MTCSEYADDADIARARSEFFTGHAPLLLLTERFHYFRRLRIRGIRHLLFYGPPANAIFYAEMLNLLEEASAGGAAHPISSTVRIHCQWGSGQWRVARCETPPLPPSPPCSCSTRALMHRHSSAW